MSGSSSFDNEIRENQEVPVSKEHDQIDNLDSNGGLCTIPNSQQSGRMYDLQHKGINKNVGSDTGSANKTIDQATEILLAQDNPGNPLVVRDTLLADT